MQLRLVLIGAALLIAVFWRTCSRFASLRLNTEVKFQQRATKLVAGEHPPSVGRRLCSFASCETALETASCWITADHP